MECGCTYIPNNALWLPLELVPTKWFYNLELWSWKHHIQCHFTMNKYQMSCVWFYDQQIWKIEIRNKKERVMNIHEMKCTWIFQTRWIMNVETYYESSLEMYHEFGNVSLILLSYLPWISRCIMNPPECAMNPQDVPWILLRDVP